MTQQNAAMVEESTTAAEEMRHHAEHLNERINSFVLGEDEPQQQALTSTASPQRECGSNSAMQGSALSAHTPSHSSSQSSPAKHAADEWEAF